MSASRRGVKSWSVSLLRTKTLIDGVTIVTTDASIMLTMLISDLHYRYLHFSHGIVGSINER